MIIDIRIGRNKKLDQIMDIWFSSNKQAHPFIKVGYWQCRWKEVREAIPRSHVLAWTKGDNIIAFLGL